MGSPKRNPLFVCIFASMFTGIIECVGKVERIRKSGNNLDFQIQTPISHELTVDQSVSHDGVCLTVTRVEGQSHWVTAIQETLSKTNLGKWEPGTPVNLERCLKIGDRLDGHWVQGHVDTTGLCTSVMDQSGSKIFEFSYSATAGHKTVPKGSITVNGTSLTVVDSEEGRFTVAIIPYTLEHTTFKNLKAGDLVNLEFDIIGKWVKAWMT